jgi:hypothetical protein
MRFIWLRERIIVFCISLFALSIFVVGRPPLAADPLDELNNSIADFQKKIKDNQALKDPKVQGKLKELQTLLAAAAPPDCKDQTDAQNCGLQRVGKAIVEVLDGKEPATHGLFGYLTSSIVTLAGKFQPSARAASAILDAVAKMTIEKVEKDKYTAPGDDETLLNSLSNATANVLQAVAREKLPKARATTNAAIAAGIADQLGYYEELDPSQHAVNLAKRFDHLVDGRENEVKWLDVLTKNAPKLLAAIKPHDPKIKITWAAYGDLYWAINDCDACGYITAGTRRNGRPIHIRRVDPELARLIDRGERTRIKGVHRIKLDWRSRQNRYCPATQILSTVCDGYTACKTNVDKVKEGTGTVDDPSQKVLPPITGDALCGYDPLNGVGSKEYTGALVVYTCNGVQKYAVLRSTPAQLSCKD